MRAAESCCKGIAAHCTLLKAITRGLIHTVHTLRIAGECYRSGIADCMLLTAVTRGDLHTAYLLFLRAITWLPFHMDLNTLCALLEAATRRFNTHCILLGAVTWVVLQTACCWKL
jgi:hypothetical protein